ncbi:YbhB/YbcL family Raf kinase inhibitor-like protein [Natronomonas marina]|jgi:Raf kinase inhibitor-like YbhB/YbcL family protein|uniref:YbhB/YbcL family Raf kinase inhibitor-like protein n=1 Tax=Natronomonas marina TaxID=2961939 RepID=UPI0020CA1335|nr:YbhB/YbcL family Raf kinase inhibitor-like protein [Natronomonas marina]
MTELTISSPAFDDGGPIPDRYGYTAENVNPPLSIAGVPDGTVSLLLLVDDPDAVEPAGHIWDHWLVWDVPPDTEEIPEDWDAEGAVEGQNDYGEQGYGGPNPPDGEHTYRFRLYALDAELGLPPSATRDDVADAVTGHIVEKATLEGTYAP